MRRAGLGGCGLGGAFWRVYKTTWRKPGSEGQSSCGAHACLGKEEEEGKDSLFYIGGRGIGLQA